MFEGTPISKEAAEEAAREAAEKNINAGGNLLNESIGAITVSEGKEFAILSNIIHQEWSGLSVKDHKNLKGLKSQNLRQIESSQQYQRNVLGLANNQHFSLHLV